MVGTIEKTERLPLWSLVSSHIGRRTFVREQIERGVPTRIIQSMTGHKSRKVFDMYYEVLDKEKTLVNDDLFLDYEENNTPPKTSTNKPPQKTPSPFSKEQKDKIEYLYNKLKQNYVCDEYKDTLQNIISGFITTINTTINFV